jgi:peptide/nickel transport system permease protein
MSSCRFRLIAAVLISFHLVALVPEFFAPYRFDEQHRSQPFAAPARIRPAVVRFFVHGYPYRLLGTLHCDRHLFGVDPPAKLFLLGTDGFGRDQFSRLLQASRISLVAAWLPTALSLAAGLLLGTLAGFYGGWLDSWIMRLGEASLALPWLYLLLACRALLPLNLPHGTAYLSLIAVVGLLGWARPARLVRGVVLSSKTRAYVVAARSFGASDAYLLRVHVIQDAFSVVATQATLLAPRFLLAEVTLSFLGLGVDEPLPSWGNMLANAQHYYVMVSYWWMLLPALPPVVLSFCCFSISDMFLARRRAVPL